MKHFDVAIIGAGFVGSSLAKYLSNHYSVVTLDVNPSPPMLKGIPNVEHRACDIGYFDEIKKKIGKPKVVIHTAIIQIPMINEVKEQAYKVNVRGTQNVCEVVKGTSEILGLILTGSWHVFGERDYGGTVDTAFGYRPDKVEERAKLYVISKMVQEGIVRFYNSMVSDKDFSIIRLGTVLGKNMPEKTAANIFISNSLQGKPITPFKHTMYRPMLYVSVDDVCKVFESYIYKIVNRDLPSEAFKDGIFNLFHPEPITILELAGIVKEAVALHTQGKISPKLEIVDTGLPPLYSPNEKYTLNVDIKKTMSFFGIEKLKSPRDAVFEIVAEKLRG